MKVVQYFLEADDDTYIFGDKWFNCEYDENTDVHFEPFIRQEDSKTIKFYRNKKFFAVYENASLVEIIKTMTCWSDDVIAYKLKDGVAYEYDEVYHGRPYKKKEVCNVDFKEFIRNNEL